MEWFSGILEPPCEGDSPILAWSNDDELGGYLNCAALHWLNQEDAWDGAGWYDHTNESGMNLEDIKYWTHLPRPDGE